MSTDHDFSPHSSARDAPVVQSSRKGPWSDVANSASAGHELPAYTALYGQLGDEELVIRPSGEPENDAEKPKNPTSSGSPVKSPEKAHDSDSSYSLFVDKLYGAVFNFISRRNFCKSVIG